MMLRLWMGKSHRRFFLLASLAVFCCGVAPSAVYSRDLLTVYRQAEATSPLVGRTKALLEGERAGGALARSALMPKMGVRAGVSGNSAHIEGFGKDFLAATELPGFATEIDEDYLGAHYSVTLTQPIVDGQAWVGLRSSEARIRMTEAQLLAVEQDLIVQVFNAYFGVLRARADHRVAARQHELLQRVLDQAQKALDIGAGDIVDVQEAKARYDGAEAALILALNEVKTAENRLERLTHQPLTSSLADLSTLEPEGPRPDEVEPWLDSARERQPLLRQARENLQIAQNEVEIAQRSRWPKLNLDAGYVYTRGGFLPSIESNQAQIGLNLSLPLYTGGEIAARVRQAQAYSTAARQETTAVEDQVILNTRNAFLMLEDSVAQFKASLQALKSAGTALDATEKGFSIGTRTIVDVLNAIRDHAESQRGYNISLYNQILARVQLKAAAGVLTGEDVEAVNALLDREDGHPPAQLGVRER